MSEWVSLLVVTAGSAGVLAGLSILGIQARRRQGAGAALGAAMAAYDEIFHPAAHRSHIEILVQDRRLAPVSTPAGPGTSTPRT